MRIEYIIGAVIVLALAAGGSLLLRTPSDATDGRADVPANERSGVSGAIDTTPGAGATEAASKPSRLTIAEKEVRYAKAPELVSPDGYINTDGEPVTIGEFRGKNPVLIDIWTFSCINCQRTFPYLRSWYEKYEDQGLVIIGVHTPEFAFEKVQANVENAADEFGLEYPIVLDNEYRTWNAFGNRYWPRKYLIDIDGYIVYDHAGEGAYETTEREIQKVLAERAERLGMTDMPEEAITTPDGTVAVDFSQVGSPEIYFGSHRNTHLGDGVPGVSGVQTLDLPERLFANTLYLGGVWDIQSEYARNNESGAQLQFIYTAKNVYMVAAADRPVRVRVLRDGEVLGGERGADVDESGYVTIQEERLYELIQGGVYETHLLEMTIEEAGLEAYTFTFG